MSVPARPTERGRYTEFDALARGEAGRLYRVALAILGDPGEAEDVLQETMVAGWRRWSALQHYEDQSRWLTRVCVRCSLRHRRLRARMTLWPPERWPSLPSGAPAGLDERLVDFHRALGTLSPAQRAMIVLHFRNGLTIDECASYLGCRPGTARSHLGRAVGKLRKEIPNA